MFLSGSITTFLGVHVVVYPLFFLIMATTYTEKLRKPEWQKKRLRIFERDNWTCRFCGKANEELQVHHIQYIHDFEPWEYSDTYLITLCDACHSIETKQSKSAYRELLCHFAQMGFSSNDIHKLNALFQSSKKQPIVTKFREFIFLLYEKVRR